MNIQILSGIFLMLSIGISAQDEIDYNPKALHSELGKLSDASDPLLLEIQIPKSLADKNPIQGKYFALDYQQGDSPISFIYVGRVNSCRAGGCLASPEKKETGLSEYFDYFVLFDKETVVRQVKVYNYQATHGQEITAKGWLKQFVGYNGNQALRVGKEIDGISGATISVYGITADIEGKCLLLKEILVKN